MEWSIHVSLQKFVGAAWIPMNAARDSVRVYEHSCLCQIFINVYVYVYIFMNTYNATCVVYTHIHTCVQLFLSLVGMCRLMCCGFFSGCAPILSKMILYLLPGDNCPFPGPFSATFKKSSCFLLAMFSFKLVS